MAIIKAYETPYIEELGEIILRQYKWEDTARKTLDAYQLILNAS
jgi:hypothetical protein